MGASGRESGRELEPGAHGSCQTRTHTFEVGRALIYTPDFISCGPISACHGRTWSCSHRRSRKQRSEAGKSMHSQGLQMSALIHVTGGGGGGGGSSSGDWARRKLQVSVVYDVDVAGSFRKLGRPLAECVSPPVIWCRSMTDELIKFASVRCILSSVLVQHPHTACICTMVVRATDGSQFSHFVWDIIPSDGYQLPQICVIWKATRAVISCQTRCRQSSRGRAGWLRSGLTFRTTRPRPGRRWPPMTEED